MKGNIFVFSIELLVHVNILLNVYLKNNQVKDLTDCGLVGMCLFMYFIYLLTAVG